MFSGTIPPPSFTHDDGTHLTEVFVAKEPGILWRSPILRRITLRARRSYRRYGNVPLIDHHDDQSTVLLIRTTLTRAALGPAEWLSVRFVHGDLLGSRDAHRFLMCLSGKVPAVRKLAPIFPPEQTFLARSAFISRISGIPAPETKGGKLIRTPYAFAHAIRAFFLLADLRNETMHHLLGIYRDELIARSLTIPGQYRRVPTFYTATEIIGRDPADAVSIDRSIVAYEFPTYFFDTAKVQELLRELLRTGAITRDALAPYVGGLGHVHTIESGRNVPYANLRDLGSLFSYPAVPIPGSTLTGAELRELIDRRVPDGPHLRIILRPTWRREVSQLIY
ncbi:MAG TPA: hypothetical protein VLB83_00245 [Candidatus Paceibacterota bacterium]|nr:hypothetical protein [Candidatus Paceibacterota bacterium]